MTSNSQGWAPITYPSSAIFCGNGRHHIAREQAHGDSGRVAGKRSSAPSEQGDANNSAQGGNIERRANPYFPLHRDVLLATMRELLILDGRIDPQTMAIVVSSGREEVEKKTMTAAGGKSKKRKVAGNNQLGEMDAVPSSSSPSNRTASNSVSDDENSASKKNKQHTIADQPHVVPTSMSLDYSQFNTAESLVEYAVMRALDISTTQKIGPITLEESLQSIKDSADEPVVTSKRKVSDVDLEMGLDCPSEFPPYIVALARSNLITLQKTTTQHSVSKSHASAPMATYASSSILTDRERNIFLSKLSSPMTMAELLPNDTANSVNTNNAIMSFLRFPQLQRQQQNQTLFAMPRLLKASITDETNLRKAARKMTNAMLDNAFPGNRLDGPLRTFLGYKSSNKSKTTSRERIAEILSDILFDVSHAMYAWIQTEEEMMADVKRNASMNAEKSAGGRVVVPKGLRESAISKMDMQIKDVLFDDRAIKRIGGFESASLLPLALGIHRCRQEDTAWDEYVLSEEGKNAMEVHLKHNLVVVEPRAKGGAKANKKKRKQREISLINPALLEIGRKRRGRRGRAVVPIGASLLMGDIAHASYIAG